jgi:hypothetical protein
MAHGLGSETGGELDEGEGVNALAARGKSADGKFIGGGTGGRDDEDAGVLGLFGQKRGGALEECGVGAGIN